VSTSAKALADKPEHLRGVTLLASLAQKLVSIEDIPSLQEEVLEHALAMFRCSSGAVCLWDGESGRIRVGPAAGTAKDIRPEDLLAADQVRTVVLGARRPLVLTLPGQSPSAAMTGWRGGAVVPIGGAETVLGLLVIGDLAVGGEFTEDDAALMSVLGSMVAGVLETRLALAEFRETMSRRMTEAMSELTHFAAELQRIKTFNEELFGSAPVGIIVFDREFRVVFRNPAAERLWPEDRSILAAARRTDIAKRDDDWESGLRDVVNMQRPWLTEEVSVPHAGREPARVTLTCSPLMSGGRTVAGGVMIVEDVTQRVHMERRLAVSERLAGVGRLAAMVAHEINNPLDGIIRLVNLARRAAAVPSEGAPAEDGRIDKYLAEAHKGLMRMAMVVRDLLEFSRSASGATEPMPIPDLLAEAVRNLAPAAEKAGVQIAIDCAPDLPLLKSGTLYHVVLNLVKNAVEAMPSGGRVMVAARGLPDAVVIEVADTGPGIPPEILPRLFEPFFTLKATGKGTGLGLVISKDLVEKQGGTVTAANRPEGGAVFTVRFPLGAAGG
jgi:signal transduction histidine kinase